MIPMMTREGLIHKNRETTIATYSLEEALYVFSLEYSCLNPMIHVGDSDFEGHNIHVLFG